MLSSRFIRFLIAFAIFFGGLSAVREGLAWLQGDSDTKTRAAALARADFHGTFAGHPITFPASPRLGVGHTCDTGEHIGCSTYMTFLWTVTLAPEVPLLNERTDPLQFQSLTISATQPDCSRNDPLCPTEDEIDQWCTMIRPDLAGSHWCSDHPPLSVGFRAQPGPHPFQRAAPDLTARFANTALGPGQVTCSNRNTDENSDKQGEDCILRFKLTEGVNVTIDAPYTQMTPDNPDLAKTIALIPEYWAALTATD